MIFEVKSPILGFEQVKKMKLEKLDEMFLKLSEAESNTPIFTLTNPYAIREYSFEVPTALQLLLDLGQAKNILVANIMIIQNPIQNSTINFLAPIIFNFDHQTMAQVVLDSLKYPHYKLSDPILNYCQDGDFQQS